MVGKKERFEKDPFVDGSVTLTNAGQVYHVSSSQETCEYIILAAHPSNAGKVWVGGRTVVADSGLPLDPGALPMVILPAVKPFTIGLLAESAADVVTFVIVKSVRGIA